MNTYHTLWNFIPFPNGYNLRKGLSILHDYLDLTLACIYNYYHENEENKIYKSDGKQYNYHCIFCLNYSEEKICFEKWLKSFVSWENFVEKNYLQTFVDTNNNYYPKELCDGHFKKGGLPKTIDECNQYFNNASEWILQRGRDMLNSLS